MACDHVWFPSYQARTSQTGHLSKQHTMLKHRSSLQDHLPPLADSHWVAWYTRGKLNNMRGTPSKFRCVSQGLKMLLKTKKQSGVFFGLEDLSKVSAVSSFVESLLFWLNYALNYVYFVNPSQHKRVWRVLRLVKYQLSPTVLLACLPGLRIAKNIPYPCKAVGVIW